LRGIEQSLDQLSATGIRPVAISADSPETTRDLIKTNGFTFTFLSDPNLEAIKAYDLVHAGAGEEGHDIARPAEFLLDSTGTVRWVNLTDNYWRRLRPEQILEAAKSLDKP
jgi:peroxiredoxin